MMLEFGVAHPYSLCNPYSLVWGNFIAVSPHFKQLGGFFSCLLGGVGGGAGGFLLDPGGGLEGKNL